jgi:Zn-dependent protease
MIALIIQLPVLMFSVILHEVAHGWAAEKFGDDTARLMGRITFNPVPHIDLFGTIILPVLALITGAPVFGWAKPVPVNSYRLRNPDRDMVWVALAGPGANLLLALLCGAIMWVLRTYAVLPDSIAISIMELARLVMVVNIILPVFNLFPIPPLDGSRVLAGLLPPKLAYEYSKLEQYGFFIVIILLTTGILPRLMSPIMNFLIILFSGGISIY